LLFGVAWPRPGRLRHAEHGPQVDRHRRGRRSVGRRRPVRSGRGYQGSPATVGGFSPWTILGAEQSGGGYPVAWKYGSADQYSIWTTNSSGAFLSSRITSGSDATLQSQETIFQQDLNGDGHIGTLAEGALATVASFDGAAAPQADATAANLTLLTNCIVSTFAAPTVTGANAAAPPLVEDYRSRPIA
jgi:hypothetical protein